MTTGSTIGSSRTRLRCSNSRSTEPRCDLVLRERRHDRGLCQKSGEVRLEAVLIDVADTARLPSFARYLKHDIGGVLERREESAGVIKEALCVLLPRRFPVGNVVHDGRTVHEHADIVAPFSMVELRAVRQIVRTVEDLVLVADQADSFGPVKDLDRPVGVGLVSGVAR